MACGKLEIDYASPAPTPASIAGCDTKITSQQGLPPIGPYPNFFYGPREGISDAQFFFNHKSWQWLCYSGGDGSQSLKCGEINAGWTAYSSPQQDFTALTNGQSKSFSMTVQEDSTLTEYQVTLACNGMYLFCVLFRFFFF